MIKVLSLLLGLSLAAMATQINPGTETPLQQVFNNIGASSYDVNADQLLVDSLWSVTSSGNATATFIIEIAGYAPDNTLGIYDPNTNATATFFSGSNDAKDRATLNFYTGGIVTVSISDAANPLVPPVFTVHTGFNSGNFGFFLQGTGGSFYSEKAKNVDGADHMVAFEGDNVTSIDIAGIGSRTWELNEYILAWEDVAATDGADFDFNDAVILVQSVKPVPEPATVSLFAFGLIAMLGNGWIRRKNA